MIIGIDWNNTIQDQIGEIVRRSQGKLTRRDFAAWDIPLGHKMGMTDNEFLDWAWKNPSIQRMARPFEGAQEMLSLLRTNGYEVKIITSSFMGFYDIQAWFYKWDIPYDTISMVKDKSLVDFDLLIDDNPLIIRQMLELGRPVLKYNLPWNSDIECHGFDGWDELVI